MNKIFTGKYSQAQVMMTLSAIAYIPFDSIPSLQDNLNSAEALENKYEVIWCAGDEAGLVYAVRNIVTRDYTIVIRGAVFQFGLAFLFDWYEDLDMGRLSSLPHSELAVAKVASGILDNVREVNDLTCDGKTLKQLVNNFPTGSKVYITGHSLGGTIASVYAAELACSNIPGLNIIPYIFGAPTAGNPAFAELFQPASNYCLFPESFWYVNSLDTIPYAWHDLQGIPGVDYGKIKCPIDLVLCLDNLTRLLILAGVTYAQPAFVQQLPGQLRQSDNFFGEAMYQHQHNTYLHLMGLNPVLSTAFSYRREQEKAFS